MNVWNITSRPKILSLFCRNDISHVFLLNLGNCDHLEPYPVYSETRHEDINLTTWNKPWPLEIDWLDSYVNLSSYHPNILQILALAYRSTKYAKYASHSKWGCMLIFPVDSELVDSHYMKYYANTNNTMYLCSPYFPVRPDMLRKYAQMYPDRHSMAKCYVVQPGFLKHYYRFGHWTYIFSPYFPVEWRVTVLTAVLICFIGLFGEYH